MPKKEKAKKVEVVVVEEPKLSSKKAISDNGKLKDQAHIK